MQLLGEGGQLVSGGNVVLVHGSVGVNHASRQILRPQLAVSAVNRHHLPV
jgi:hypothetical protein